MVSTLVERRLQDFERRCGPVALRLAYHAALPVALNPELLHFLRINFFAEELPYTVEFEFLTSGLCREIGSDLYEIEPEIRNELLLRLAKEDNGRNIILDVATLLWQYVEYHAPWTEKQELERAQQLTALNFLNPQAAQLWLKNAEVIQGAGGERQWLIAMRQEINELPDLSSTENIKLTVRQKKQLHSALLKVFPSYSDLEIILRSSSDVSLNYISGNNLSEVVFNLIEWAKSQGRLEKLLSAVIESHPRNQDLRSVYKQIFGLPLLSERGVDYTHLRDLLAAGNWKEADRETGKVMYQVAGRTSEGWLREEDIDNFPCVDLRTINQLWLHYSKGKFGFSVQKEIYESLGGTREYNQEVWKEFGDHVGWRKNENWVSYYSDLFDMSERWKNTKRGHLPTPPNYQGMATGNELMEFKKKKGKKKRAGELEKLLMEAKEAREFLRYLEGEREAEALQRRKSLLGWLWMFVGLKRGPKHRLFPNSIPGTVKFSVISHQ